jgi:carbon-monoxide dehydrogenase small subunit
MILAGKALLLQNTDPTRGEIRKGISSVMCRCTGYQQIIDAIEETAHLRQAKLKNQAKNNMESAL